VVHDGRIIIRSHPDSAITAHADHGRGTVVLYEADDIDPVTRTGQPPTGPPASRPSGSPAAGRPTSRTSTTSRACIRRTCNYAHLPSPVAFHNKNVQNEIGWAYETTLDVDAYGLAAALARTTP
jgi:hypothetical protein